MVLPWRDRAFEVELLVLVSKPEQTPVIQNPTVTWSFDEPGVPPVMLWALHSGDDLPIPGEEIDERPMISAGATLTLIENTTVWEAMAESASCGCSPV
jgi:hypothetical protein